MHNHNVNREKAYFLKCRVVSQTFVQSFYTSWIVFSLKANNCQPAQLELNVIILIHQEFLWSSAPGPVPKDTETSNLITALDQTRYRFHCFAAFWLGDQDHWASAVNNTSGNTFCSISVLISSLDRGLLGLAGRPAWHPTGWRPPSFERLAFTLILTPTHPGPRDADHDYHQEDDDEHNAMAWYLQLEHKALTKNWP